MSVVGGNNSYEKEIKTDNIRIISVMFKMSIVSYNGCVWKSARKRNHAAVANMVYIMDSVRKY